MDKPETHQDYAVKIGTYEKAIQDEILKAEGCMSRIRHYLKRHKELTEELFQLNELREKKEEVSTK